MIFEGGPPLARLSGFQWTHTGQVQHWFRRTHITLCLQYSIFFSTGPSLYICHFHTSFCLAIFWGIHVYDMLYFSHQPFSFISHFHTGGRLHFPFSHRRAMDINVFGLIRGIQTVLPLIRFSLWIYLALEEIFNNFIRKAKGRVVTITSGLGVMAVPTRWEKMFIILQGVPKNHFGISWELSHICS